MMAGGLREEERTMQDRPALRIIRGEDDTRDPRETRRTRAHCARLKRHEKARTRQSFISERRSSRPQHEDLGMGGRIAVLDDAIAVARKNFAIGRNHDGAHRDLAACTGRRSFRERQIHDLVVCHRALATIPPAQYLVWLP